MQKGCIQLYFGDGKGKTTAAIGQIVRCAGHGFKVLFYQFLKEPKSGEIMALSKLSEVTYIQNEGSIPFVSNLSPAQQEYYREIFLKKFHEFKELYFGGEFDLAVLDEVIDAYQLGILPKEELWEVMDKKPEQTELVITGHSYGMSIDELIQRADYVTECKKIKHPFDKGQCCRKGIEE